MTAGVFSFAEEQSVQLFNRFAKWLKQRSLYFAMLSLLQKYGLYADIYWNIMQ